MLQSGSTLHRTDETMEWRLPTCSLPYSRDDKWRMESFAKETPYNEARNRQCSLDGQSFEQGLVCSERSDRELESVPARVGGRCKK